MKGAERDRLVARARQVERGEAIDLDNLARHQAALDEGLTDAARAM
jgi:hypothetical protein